MKILMVLMGLEIGGAETHVAELATELARRGNEVWIASNGGVYEYEIAKNGITHCTFPLHTKKPSAIIKSYFGLKRIIKKQRFDIVHAHARIPAFICSILHKQLRFRFITSAHWVFKTNAFLTLITNWGERSVAVSNDIKAYLIDKYDYDKDKIDVTINGIDTNKFSCDTDYSDIKEEFNFGENKRRIVYVSRMDKDRSAVAFNLIDITKRLYDRYPNLEVVIVGGGNDYQRLCDSINEVNSEIGERIIISTGARTDINKFVASSDIFIGVSRAALEAMSAKKPVIIGGNEGYIGVFDNSKEDISVKTNFCCRGCDMPDNDRLFEDICKIFDDTDIVAMSEYNRDYILKNYSVEKMTNDYENAYKKLLENNPFRENDILISGYYGFKNTGDDSLLKSIILNLREQKEDITITVLSRNPKETAQIYNVRSINRINIINIIKTLRHTRLLISGGGSLLQDVTSSKSYRYYSTIIKLAYSFKTKVMIYANGIGPLNSVKNRSDCKKLLERADVITLRDADSLNELKKIGVKKEVTVSADPAFYLNCPEKAAKPEYPYFVVSVRRWSNMPKEFSQHLAEVCKRVYEKYGLKPLFVPMHNKFDKDICTKIAQMCDGELKSDFNSLDDLLMCIKASEFVLGMRLHCLIYALCMNIPVIALSYDPKIDAIVNRWTCCNAFDVKGIDADILFGEIERIIENREDISSEIKEITKEMKEKTIHDARTAVDLMSY